MSVADQIEALRAEFPLCRSITFTDLATGLVLCSANRERVRQEQLDALASKARALLDGAATRPFHAGEASDTLQIGTIVLSEPSRCQIFLRSEADPDEGIACDCDPGIDIEAIVHRGRSELARIGATH